jgi:hypothetical protein
MWFYIVLVAVCVLAIYLTSGPKWKSPSRKDTVSLDVIEIEKLRSEEEARQDNNKTVL